MYILICHFVSEDDLLLIEFRSVHELYNVCIVASLGYLIFSITQFQSRQPASGIITMQ